MNFNTDKRFIHFVKHRKKFFMLSLVMTLVGVILLSTLGLNLGIDFESGSRVDILADDTLTEEEVYEQFAEAGGYEPDDVTLAGDNNNMASATFIGTLSREEIAEVQTHFDELYGQEPSVSTVSPQVGQELAKNAFISVLIASLGIIIYVSIRFQFWYGLAAIVSLAHDAFFILVVFSILQFEVNIPFIAAVLTIVGYSINDTIVTFDRIRENIKYTDRLKTFDDLSYVVDLSLNQTLTRSINTVLTVVFAAAALFILGGEAIRSFSLALLIGLIAGTYSSLFLAAQLWVVWKWKQMERDRKKPKKEEPDELEPEV
ncbi:protein translocase subunit SecF [Alteribacillus iranensis]|uniref:Protein-export membrane protein SecF n=1 Tax=Alteribacillus iranensis TaxID=930128 RepID=A0A1I1Z648_9BACI|nr:protein translocase subunit SecF [Alteribacillus iranensis]SFE27324.1 preprotein translocase subunit SecF/SecD/SecF fusion protein [Alteribacillus iranensis]